MSAIDLPDNSTLILDELDIPGRTGPVSQSPPVWGINLAAARDNFPRQGLQCRAGPWGEMRVGDLVKVFWGTGVQALQKTVDKHEENTVLQLFVPPERISEGRFKVFYSVKPLGQTDELSEVMEVLVKLTRPGGHDENGEPGHSMLVMRIPKEILEGGIDQDNVADGVPITIEPYPNAAAGDVIQLTWGGVFVLSTPLTQDQADGKQPIVVHVDEAIIREADDSDDTGLAVAFEVYDVVDNRSEDWSAAQRVVVAIDSTRLIAPLLKEAQNNVLDVDKLGNANGTAQILAVDGSRFKVGDIIILRVKGTPVEGAPIDLEIPGAPLISVPSVPEITIPNAVLRQLAKSQIALSYRLKKADNSPDLRSKTQFITAIGEVQRLAAPKALDAVQGALDPTLAQVRVEIPFDASFAAGQAIKVFWLGTRPDLSPYLPDLPLHPITSGEISAGKPLLITVDGTHLAPINGGKLELYYQLLIEDAVLGTMTRVNATHAVRESIHADMLQVGEPRLELPEPQVAGVVDGVLPADTAGTTLTVAYLDTVKDDEVVYEWVGSKTGKASDSVKLTSFTAGQKVTFTIGAALIKGNEGGTVSASYFIKRAAGGISYSNALAFSIGVALELKAPGIKEASGASLDPIKAKDALTAVVDYTGMAKDDEIIVTWTGAAGTPAGGSHITEVWPVTVIGVQQIPLLNSVVAFNLGKEVAVSYTVKRGTAQPLPSLPLTLSVQNIPNEHADLPKPSIDTAADNELDLPSLNGDEQLRVAKWPLQVSGQGVWLRYDGLMADGTEVSNVIWEGAAHHSANGLVTLAPIDWLRGLKDGSELKIEFKVNFDGRSDKGTAVTFPVRIYTIKAVEDVKPAITSVKGSPSGADIDEGGVTVETSVTLTGTASPGQKVEVFDGAVSKGETTVNPTTDIWTLTVTSLSIAAHSFTAKALYGTGQTSAARTLTVTAVVAPTITSVKGSPSNAEIPNGGTTIETSVVLSGTASKGQKVQVLDGTTPKGEPPVNPTTGDWEQMVEGLNVAAHTFTVKALYGSGQISTSWSITIKNLISGYENWEAEANQDFLLNIPVIFKSGLTIEFREGGRGPLLGTTSGGFGKRTLYIKAHSKSRFSLAGLIKTVELMTFFFGTGEISFFDGNGNHIQTEALPFSRDQVMRYKYSAVSGIYINYFEVNIKHGGDIVALDELKWY